MDKLLKLFESLDEEEGMMNAQLLEQFVVILESVADLLEGSYARGFSEGARIAFDQVPMNLSTRKVHVDQIPHLLEVQLGTIKANRPDPKDYGLGT